MATFDVSFLSKSTGSSGGGSVNSMLADQLQILQSTLARDGYLAPGDYDLLIETAQTLMTTPGLTPAQRSDYSVKIAAFQKDKAQGGMKLDEDIDRLNRQLDSESSEDTIIAGNDPALYLQGREASLKAKLDALSETIQRREANGNDTTEHVQEFTETLRSLQDVVGAQEASTAFDGSNPIPGFAAYVSTNDRGEIVDVTYGRYGAKTGYAETNGMINGFQVFGKVNAKQNGKNVFVLGNNRFSAPDFMQPDPENPGSMKVQRLVSESMQSGDGFKRGEAGFLNVGPDQLQTQSYIPRNTWFKSSDGTLYHRGEDGKYGKYLNFTPDGVDMDSLFVIPKALERTILPFVSATIDPTMSNFIGPRLPNSPGNGSIPMAPVGPASANPALPTNAASPLPSMMPGADLNQGGGANIPISVAPAGPPAATVSQAAPSPTQRSPQNPLQYAKQTVSKAGKFFKDLFS